MKDQFVTPEIARLLKEKGFADECMAQYQIALTSQKDDEKGYEGSFGWKKGEVTFDKSYFVNNSKHDYSNKNWLGCAAPLWQQVIEWFLKEHNRYLFINRDGGWWIINILDLSNEDEEGARGVILEQCCFDDLSIAKEHLIKYALNLI